MGSLEDLDVRSTVIANLADGITRKEDEIIEGILSQHLGHEWKTSNHKADCLMTVFPDGRRVLSVCGKEVAEMFPAEFTQEQTSTGVTLRATQKYRRL